MLYNGMDMNNTTIPFLEYFILSFLLCLLGILKLVYYADIDFLLCYRVST